VVRAQWKNALHMLRPTSLNWAPPVITLSALHKEGIVEFWAQVEKYCAALTPTGEFAARRQRQSVDWMWSLIDSGLRQYFRQHPAVRASLAELSQAVSAGRTTPGAAAYRLLEELKH
jgi:LAO/AO transport system kinase